jgi:hypothetical protein
MNIRTSLDPEILEAAKRAAANEGTSLAEYLRKVLEQKLEAEQSGSGQSEVSDGKGEESEGTR